MKHSSAPVTEARLEAALLQSASIAASDPRYRPIFDRIECELLDLRETEPVARARIHLRNQSADGTHARIS